MKEVLVLGGGGFIGRNIVKVVLECNGFEVIDLGVDFEIIKKSGFAAFDKAAELAVRNALLEPLPNALAENPPYIVTIRIVPQN